MSELNLYQKLYTELFNAVTDVISALDFAHMEAADKAGLQKELALDDAIERAVITLRKAQQKNEQIYIEG